MAALLSRCSYPVVDLDLRLPRAAGLEAVSCGRRMLNANAVGNVTHVPEMRNVVTFTSSHLIYWVTQLRLGTCIPSDVESEASWSIPSRLAAQSALSEAMFEGLPPCSDRRKFGHCLNATPSDPGAVTALAGTLLCAYLMSLPWPFTWNVCDRAALAYCVHGSRSEITRSRVSLPQVPLAALWEISLPWWIIWSFVTLYDRCLYI